MPVTLTANVDVVVDVVVDVDVVVVVVGFSLNPRVHGHGHPPTRRGRDVRAHLAAEALAPITRHQPLPPCGRAVQNAASCFIAARIDSGCGRIVSSRLGA
ncbi:MAG: hypothetical protein AB2L07_03185 [Thermoanaerobaculaceae bacterium]